MSKALPKLPVTWNWSGVNTSKNDRSLLPGELVSLVNWRRTVEGRLQKRLGNDKTTVSSFSGGSYAGPCTDLVPSDLPIVRDTSDQIFALNGSTGYMRGTDPRAHPTVQNVEGGDPSVTTLAGRNSISKPQIATSGGRLFLFSPGFTNTAGISDLQYVLYDASTGALVKRSFIAGIDRLRAYAVAPDPGGGVWVAWVTGAAIDTINTGKIDTSGTVGGGTSFVVTGADFKDIKLRLMPNNEILVAAVSLDTVGANLTAKRYLAYLNTATGGPKVSPAASFTTIVTGPVAGSISCAPGLSIADSQDDTSSYFVHFWHAANTTDFHCHQATINPTTLVASTSFVRSVTVSAGTTIYTGGTCAYYTSGVVTLFSSLYGNDVGPVDCTVVKSVSGVDTTVARSAVIAGDDVIKVSSRRFFLTQFDDGTASDIPSGAQRGYFLRDTAGRLLTSILDGSAGVCRFNGTADGTSSINGTMTAASGHEVSMVVSGTKVYIPLLQTGAAQSIHEPVLATVDFAATWCSNAPNFVPGGIPKTVSKADVVTEAAPVHYPYRDFSVTDNGTHANQSRNHITFRYVTHNAAGERVPSAPRPIQTIQFKENSPAKLTFILRIPTLRHTCGPTYIEIYMSDDQDSSNHDTKGPDLYLAATATNDPTADSVDVTVYPNTFLAGRGELLDTTNLTERLPNTSVPPARLATIWRNRLFLAGTSEGDIPYSQEKRDGHGYEFNAGGLTVSWPDGTGPVTAICALSFDALAVFRRDAIGLVTGAGPDPAGNNNYQVQTISTQKGTTIPAAVALGPAGLYFFNAADNRPNLLTPAGQIVDISQGFESYRSQSIVCGLHDEAQGCMRWYCASGKQLKLDYRHPLADQATGPLAYQATGQWIEDSNSNLPAAVGAAVISGAAVMLEAGSVSVARTWQAGTSFADDGTAVLVDLTTGKMAPPGLLNEFDLDEFQLSSAVLGGNSAYSYTLTSDQGATEVHTDAASATPDVWFRSAIARTREFRLRITETSATGEGRSFDGIVAVIRPRGQLQNPYRRIG